MIFASRLRPSLRRLLVLCLILGTLAPTATRYASGRMAGLWPFDAAPAAAGTTATVAGTAAVSTRANLPHPLLSPVPFWHTNPDGTPVRFDPCRTVAWVFNPAYEPPDGLQAVQAAFERVTEETGVRFEYEGEVDEMLWEGRDPVDRERYGNRWAPILVGWAPPHPAGLLSSAETVATTHVSTAPDPLTSGNEIVVTAQIVLNADMPLVRTGPGRLPPMDSWGSAVLHELGHVLGLDHTEDPTSLMHPRAATALDFTHDDLLALRHVGREAGCLASPAVGRD
ncbi:MAG: matrixin family metalloprotease [Acidimicrobiia bacterium]|nr:matrixin family metalloprotease [Acidimicrobiia bacterium]